MPVSNNYDHHRYHMLFVVPMVMVLPQQPGLAYPRGASLADCHSHEWIMNQQRLSYAFHNFGTPSAYQRIIAPISWSCVSLMHIYLGTQVGTCTDHAKIITDFWKGVVKARKSRTRWSCNPQSCPGPCKPITSSQLMATGKWTLAAAGLGTVT